MSRERFAVASAHPLSTWVGLHVLREGGNAYDAALAVSATLPVVQPHSNGLGADFFAVVRDGRSFAINSSGPSGNEATIDRYRALGARRIPEHGPLASITVPGMVGAWGLLADRGRWSWKRSLAPAIRLAADGFRPSSSLVRAVRSVRWSDQDFRSEFADVSVRRALRRPELARTLSRIASDEGHGFYHGALARAVCRDLQEKGGLLEPDDFDRFVAQRTRPLSVRYHGHLVETNPPPSQGATALVWLRLLDRVDLGSVSESEYLRALVRTMRVAYSYRARYIGDPDFVRFPRGLLRNPREYPADALGPTRRSGHSDTTAFSVYDGDVGVSAIQSNFGGFGSGILVHGTGITLNNRGSYFSLEPSHHNALAPRKRTFHTLMATCVTGTRTVLFGSMGGDIQPQVNVQVLTRHLDRQTPLPEAIAAPRFAYSATIYGPGPFQREPGLPLANVRAVRHPGPLFGTAQGISVGPELEVGFDPRGDGLLPLSSYGGP